MPLVVFLPGTGSKPETARLPLKAVAEQGCRVIGVECDDEPTGNVEYPRDPDPRCAAAFRDMRSFGSSKRPAPWLYREGTRYPARSSAALQCPAEYGAVAEGQEPYHVPTIKNPAYVPQWRNMFGQASARRAD